MSTRLLDNTTAEEKLIGYGLMLTYPVYMLGGLYVLGSVLGWMVFAVLLLRAYVDGEKIQVPLMAWVWILGMLLMAWSLCMGHLNYDLGLGQWIKSMIGWAKGWALIALFIFLGAVMPFKRALIARAACILGLHTLIFFVISLLVLFAGLSGEIYLSPLKAVGGPGDEFFQVKLFGINPETGRARWQFFAPWSPAIGLQSCLLLLLCLQEENKNWRLLGVLGAFCLCVFAQSRAGWVIFIAILPLVFFLSRLQDPLILLIGAIVAAMVLLLGQPIIEFAFDSYQQIKESRPDSTRVRGALASIALQRWEHEAPIWGHGIVERGPKMVEYMAIGTHHSWLGLLFVKGLVGLFALALPMFLSFFYLLFIAQKSPSARSALGMIVVLIAYSFFENLEILAYLYWPALLWIGTSFNPVKEAKEDSSSLSQHYSPLLGEVKA